jgi:hypothetical protein
MTSRITSILIADMKTIAAPVVSSALPTVKLVGVEVETARMGGFTGQVLKPSNSRRYFGTLFYYLLYYF